MEIKLDQKDTFLKMGLFHEKSSGCRLGELDLLSAHMDQMSIGEKLFMEVMPLSAITDGGPVEGEHFFDMSNTLLHLRVKMTNVDRTNIPPGRPDQQPSQHHLQPVPQ